MCGHCLPPAHPAPNSGAAGLWYPDLLGTPRHVGSMSTGMMLCHGQWFLSVPGEQGGGEKRVGSGVGGRLAGLCSPRERDGSVPFDLQRVGNMLEMSRAMQM